MDQVRRCSVVRSGWSAWRDRQAAWGCESFRSFPCGFCSCAVGDSVLRRWSEARRYFGRALDLAVQNWPGCFLLESSPRVPGDHTEEGLRDRPWLLPDKLAVLNLNRSAEVGFEPTEFLLPYGPVTPSNGLHSATLPLSTANFYRLAVINSRCRPKTLLKRSLSLKECQSLSSFAS